MKDATFSSARLLKLYERISDAEDAIPRLRRFVLDLAVRGKLVKQDTAEESASELMKRAKKLKDEEGVKTEADPIQGDDIPFPAPLGWIWARLGAIALQTGSGSTPRGGKSAYSDDGTPFLRSQNVYDDGLRLDDVVYINDETNEKMKRTKVKPKDLLLNITGGSIGRCSRIPDQFSGANVSQHVAIIRTAVPGTEEYLHLLVRSPFFQDYVLGEQTGAGRGGLPKNRMDRIPVPLPPLAEQHRIVAKVDELMALCDQLEQARAGREVVRDRLTTASLARLTAPETDAETFQSNARFALQSLSTLTTRLDQIKTLRQTILNLAVRGKLVEQDAGDEQAAELLNRIEAEKAARLAGGRAQMMMELDAVSADEQDFEIPETWLWTRLGSVIKLWNGFAFKSSDFKTTGTPVIRIGDLADGEVRLSSSVHVSSEVANSVSDEVWIPEDALLLAMSGATTGKTAFNRTGQKLLLNQRVGRIETFSMNINFIRFFFETIIARNLSISLGTAIPNLSTKQINETAIPLPPLAEQHRIVAKVDALMALCDQLEASLTTTATTRSKLLTALLHEALEPVAETADA